MAAPKKIRTLAGTTPPATTAGKDPAVPLNPQQLYARVEQLTNTVNELISRFNVHTHSANDTAVIAGQQVAGGAGVTATDLFTTN